MIPRSLPHPPHILRCGSCTALAPYQCIRRLHRRIPQRPVPQPTQFVPDVNTFLTLIGRKLSQHAAKIPSWEALFSLSSTQLRDLGVEPARSRRYLLHWRERFRNGDYGVGGDAEHVKDGVARVRIAVIQSNKPAREGQLATATTSPGTRSIVVNVPHDRDIPIAALNTPRPMHGCRVKGARTISGSFVEAISQKVSVITVKEGLWEQKRGHKVDGGERRKAEVRAKRRAIANKQ